MSRQASTAPGIENVANTTRPGHRVWRPLVDVVETDPLVCCDVRTVQEDDLDIVQKVMDDTIEESMYLKRREGQQWYWMSDQTRDDVIIMTVWDSNTPFKKSGERRLLLSYRETVVLIFEQRLFRTVQWFSRNRSQMQSLARALKYALLCGMRSQCK